MKENCSMNLTSNQIKDATVGLFLQESERDKQQKVGASQISDPCTRHLAHALVGTEEAPAKYWMGGKIGTAIHSFIESAISTSSDSIFSNAIVERKIVLGTIEGYGTVSSKPDLVLADYRLLVDWKTTSRKKIKALQNYVDGIKLDGASEYTVKKYLGQANLYAWGLNQAGTVIEDIALVFINRDGTYENDIYVLPTKYDESFAVALWDRLVSIWKALENGAHPNEFEPHPECFKCSIGI
jgi:hypothetical protein